MRLRLLRSWAGFSEWRFSGSAIVDLHEVADFPQHACEHRAVVVLGGLADLSEPERAASERPRISCLIVVPCFGTVKRFFFASSTAFVLASGTSRALP